MLSPFYRNRILRIFDLPETKRYARKLFPAIQQHLDFKIDPIQEGLKPKEFKIESLHKNIYELKEEEATWKQQTESPEVLHIFVKENAWKYPS